LKRWPTEICKRKENPVDFPGFPGISLCWENEKTLLSTTRKSIQQTIFPRLPLNNYSVFAILIYLYLGIYLSGHKRSMAKQVSF
jgi:hypothetical protein